MATGQLTITTGINAIKCSNCAISVMGKVEAFWALDKVSPMRRNWTKLRPFGELLKVFSHRLRVHLVIEKN